MILAGTAVQIPGVVGYIGAAEDNRPERSGLREQTATGS